MATLSLLNIDSIQALDVIFMVAFSLKFYVYETVKIVSDIKLKNLHCKHEEEK